MTKKMPEEQKKRIARPIGRPSKMTKETKDKLIQALIGCCSIADACAYAEIAPSTYEAWKAKANADKEEGRQSEFVEFVDDIARATSKAKPRLILLLSKAAERDPRTALALLARRYPNEWGEHNEMEVVHETKGGDRIAVRWVSSKSTIPDDCPTPPCEISGDTAGPVADSLDNVTKKSNNDKEGH